jgi:hypothetical protein
MVTHKKKEVNTPYLEVGTQEPMRPVTITGPSSPEEAKLASVHQFLGYKGTHSINDEQLTTDILACWAREEHDRTCKVFGLSPSSCRDTFRNLAQPCRVRQKFLIPEGQNDVSTKQTTNGDEIGALRGGLIDRRAPRCNRMIQGELIELEWKHVVGIVFDNDDERLNDARLNEGDKGH